MLYEDVFRELHRRDVKYLVTGGIAVNLHGFARLTMDLDIMLDLSEQNLASFIAAMDTLGYQPRVPVNARDLLSEEKRKQWIREKGAIVFTFVSIKRPFRQIDIFLSNPIAFGTAYNKKHVIQLNEIFLPLASVDDLIMMKKKADRPRDREDIGHLERLKKNNGK